MQGRPWAAAAGGALWLAAAPAQPAIAAVSSRDHDRFDSRALPYRYVRIE